MKLKKALCKKCLIEEGYLWDSVIERYWRQGFCTCPYFGGRRDGAYAIKRDGTSLQADDCPYILEQTVFNGKNR
jgi:hypothetical protein